MKIEIKIIRWEGMKYIVKVMNIFHRSTSVKVVLSQKHVHNSIYREPVRFHLYPLRPRH